MDYFKKIEKNPYQDLLWNIPEKKQGIVNIVGGNGQNFRTVIKISEFLGEKYPLEKINSVLPDALKTKLPVLPNLIFLPSTESGSFADGVDLEKTFLEADFNLLIGDLSKNSITGKAVTTACQNAKKPTLVTRDAVDLATENLTENTIMNENLMFFASMPQLQKILRAVYYPKVLLLSQSLVQVAEVLHKFTLSYPISIVTLHSGQILIAKNGKVVAISLEESGVSPIMFWQGEVAAKIVAINLYNPNNFIAATIAGIIQK